MRLSPVLKPSVWPVVLVFVWACDLTTASVTLDGRVAAGPPKLAVTSTNIADGLRLNATCSGTCEFSFRANQDLSEADWSEWQTSPTINIEAKTLADAGPYSITVRARNASDTIEESQAFESYLKPAHLAAATDAAMIKVRLTDIAQRRGRTVVDMLKFDAAAIMPTTFVEADRELFGTYSTAILTRPDNWLKKLGSLSGIAFNEITSGTLITARHFVMAQHFQRGVGSSMVFHDAAGNPVVRTVVATQNVPNQSSNIPDIAVGKLDQPVPDSIETFAVLDGTDPFPPEQLAQIPYLLTEQQRRVYVHLTSAAYGRSVYGSDNPTLPSFMTHYLVGGDSGHPTFIILGGHAVLMSTHTFAGYGFGPYYGSVENQSDIQTILNSL